jgi:methylase of polypeptide subunit release factors
VVIEADPRLQLLRELKLRNYQFTAVTPATHHLVLSRPFSRRPTLRDIFGWNRPFAEDDVDGIIIRSLRATQQVTEQGGMLRSGLRVASIGDDLFLHSAFPTTQADAVFFGPDTYRFVRFVRQQLVGARPARIVDMGAGSGAGGVIAARFASGSQVTLVDSNARALDFARINAAAAGVELEFVHARAVPAGADLVIANPPYMMDADRRTYRDGGALLGGSVALQWVEQALNGLAPEGTMLLYVGAAFEEGRSPLLEALEGLCATKGASLAWEELDPDVFGDELHQAAYAHVERIAALGVVITLGIGSAKFEERWMHRPLPHEGVFARLAPSSIHGIGVFAQQRIEAGTNVFANDRREIDWVPAAVLEDGAIPPRRRQFYADFAIRRGTELGCPDNFNLLTVGWYLNEPLAGEQPNIVATADFDLVAMRDIEAWEELTVDYSSFASAARK